MLRPSQRIKTERFCKCKEQIVLWTWNSCPHSHITAYSILLPYHPFVGKIKDAWSHGFQAYTIEYDCHSMFIFMYLTLNFLGDSEGHFGGLQCRSGILVFVRGRSALPTLTSFPWGYCKNLPISGRSWEANSGSQNALHRLPHRACSTQPETASLELLSFRTYHMGESETFPSLGCWLLSKMSSNQTDHWMKKITCKKPAALSACLNTWTRVSILHKGLSTEVTDR